MPKNRNGSPDTSFKVLLALAFAAMIGIGLWSYFALPRFSSVALKIDRPTALNIARDYLRDEFGVDPGIYQSASVFSTEDSTDTFLQRVLGSTKELEFLKKYDYDLFYWSVRFFRPGEKEEYRVVVSSRSGQVIGHDHQIEETAVRPETTPKKAREIASRFLSQKAGIRLKDYVLKDETRETKDKRVEFGFSWRHKDVDLTWDRLPDGGKAKLLAGASVSGEEIQSFYKADFSIPETFSRFMDQEMEVGRNLSMAFYLVYLAFVIIMIVVLIRCRQHMALRTVRPVLIRIGVVMGAISFLSAVNLTESIIMSYPTSQDFRAFWGRAYFNAGISSALSTVVFILIALAAEASHDKGAIPSSGRGSLLLYARSSFLSRGVAISVAAGCLLACVILGVQSLVFATGERFCGVWVGEQWLTEFSSAYWPFLAAVFIGLRAALFEEMIFRVFAIHWLAYRLKNVILAVVIASAFWGFGHSGYQVFPMWFRGVEVTILGLIFSWAYLRFGLLTVLVGHYLFDAFWASAGSLFSPSAPLYFWSAIAVLSIPVFWGIWAWLSNRSTALRPLDWSLNPSQMFHLKVLHTFVERSSRDGVDLSTLKQDCLQHAWDPAVVEKAFEPVEKGPDTPENKSGQA